MNLFDVYSIFDINIVKAEGLKLWDNHGREYLDFYGGHAVISIGHTHKHYVDAISAQLNKIGFYSNSIQIPIQHEFAKKLGELSGYEDYNLFMCNSGAEANENAFKVASFYNGRKKIIAFKSAFHGRTSMAVASTDNKNILAPVNQTDNVIFLPLNETEQLEAAMNESISAVIIEGIQGVGGINVPDIEFLKKIQALCLKYGSLMIVDEIQSGYGRTGKFFAHQWSSVQPDIITMAKGMGNGFPVAGVMIHPTIAAKKEMLGTTFGGAYLACAAAISVIDVIKKEELINNALEMGNYLIGELKKIPEIKEVRGMGLMIGIEFYENAEQIRKDLLFNQGIFTGYSSYKKTIRLLPPLCITKEEADIFINALDSQLKSLKNEKVHHSEGCA
jgi:acetylornithine/N-succinyldiaminopimelate aminotransferase